MKLKIILMIIVVFVIGGLLTMKNYREEQSTDYSDKKVLVAYFSRTGEQYSVGNITEGNTAIVAKIIAEKTDGDLFEIQVVDDNYPTTYKELTEYAEKEMQENARPEIVGKIENFADYDVVFIGYPIWWGDKPMPVYTFIENYDFNGKFIVPFATHEGSGFMGTQGFAETGARVLNGLGIYGHVAQTNKEQTEKLVTEWLDNLNL